MCAEATKIVLSLRELTYFLSTSPIKLKLGLQNVSYYKPT